MEEKDVYAITESGLIDLRTGELIDPKDYVKENFEFAKELLQEANQIARDFGFNFKARITKTNNRKYLCSKVKDGYDFQKIMQISAQQLFQNKMDVYSKAFIAQFTPYLFFPENYIRINNEPPSIEKLSEMMGIKRNKMYEVIQELQYYEVIKKVKSNRSTYIYFNPFLYSVGLVDLKTVNMFVGSVYNPKES